MTKEEKELVLKDLCARLPYNIKVAIDFQSYIACLPDDKDLEYPYRKNLNFILGRENKTIEDISMKPNILYAYPCKGRFLMFNGYTYQEDYGVPVEFIKPYLRPLSSMTEDEFQDLKRYSGLIYDQLELQEFYDNSKCLEFYLSEIPSYVVILVFDWLNKNMFDYRSLIPRGLALEAPDDMYKI